MKLLKHIQLEGRMKYEENLRSFNPPNADGLKKELLKRNGEKFRFRVGKGIDVPIDAKDYERTDYPIFMGGEKIGTLLDVSAPKFYNIVYTGRIPGYVNECIASSNKWETNFSNMPVDTVGLQFTVGMGIGSKPGRQDGHTKLRFP